jgi:hypothetical protein
LGILLGGGVAMVIPPCQILGWILIGISAVLIVIVGYYRWKEFEIESLKSSVKKAKVVWAFWYTGSQALADKVIQGKKPTSIKELILLKPEIGIPNSAFEQLTTLANGDTKEDKRRLVDEINSLTEKAKNAIPKVDIYYHTQTLSYSFTIFDPKPIGNLPNSKHAWIIVLPIEPGRAKERVQWHKWVVKNKGEDKEQFNEYYKLFKDIRSKSEQIY